MGSVPSKVGVFFGKTDKVAEGWYWTDTSIGQKRKAAITGPFETKEQAVENAAQCARQAPKDEPAISNPRFPCSRRSRSTPSHYDQECRRASQTFGQE